MFDADKALKEALKHSDQTELKELQEKEKAKLGTPLNPKATYGRRAIALALDALEHLDPNNPDDRRAIAFEYERLAEGYALIGNLEMAVHYSTERVAEYQQYLDAVKKGDEWCKCPQTTAQGKNFTAKTNGRFLADKFLYKDKEYRLYKCNRCGFVNAS